MQKPSGYLLFFITCTIASAAFCEIIHGKINVFFDEKDWLSLSKPFTQQETDYEINGLIGVDTDTSGEGIAKLPKFVEGMMVNGRMKKINDSPEGCSYYSISFHTEYFTSIMRGLKKADGDFDILFYPAHSAKPQTTLTAVYCPPNASPADPYDLVIQAKHFSDSKETAILPIVTRHILGYVLA